MKYALGLYVLLLSTSAQAVTCSDILKAHPDFCSKPPQPHECCFPATPPSPLARPDGRGGFILAPDECQGENNPVIHPDPLPHCAQWADPNPPTFNGCDYVNTPFEQLSFDCQLAFFPDGKPCTAISWQTFLTVLSRTKDPTHKDSPLRHWISACRTIEAYQIYAAWLEGLPD